MREIAAYLLTLIVVAMILPLLAEKLLSRELAARGPFDCGSGYLVAGCWERR